MNSYDALDVLQNNTGGGIGSSITKTRQTIGKATFETGWWVHWDLLHYLYIFEDFHKRGCFFFFNKGREEPIKQHI